MCVWIYARHSFRWKLAGMANSFYFHASIFRKQAKNIEDTQFIVCVCADALVHHNEINIYVCVWKILINLWCDMGSGVNEQQLIIA